MCEVKLTSVQLTSVIYFLVLLSSSLLSFPTIPNFKVEKLQSSEKQNISILDFLVYYFQTTFFIYLVVVAMWKEKDKDIEIDTHIM